MLRLLSAHVGFLVFFAVQAAAQLPIEYYIPGSGARGMVIRHGAFTLQYNERTRQADWVVYSLSPPRLAKKTTEAGRFAADPNVSTNAVKPDDYRNSGYDRGQLVPEDDMRWSKTALAESYYMSVVSPMKPAFRKGPWAQLGAEVRRWAGERGEIIVVAGPIFSKSPGNAGATGIAAPEAFFRAILDVREPGIEGIGFILPAGGARKPLMSYAVSIDEVEEASGFDLFPNLPDPAEKAIEAACDTTRWAPSAAADSVSKRDAAIDAGRNKTTGKNFVPAALCRGVAADGKRCMRMTTNPNGYCWEHQDQAKPTQKR